MAVFRREATASQPVIQLKAVHGNGLDNSDSDNNSSDGVNNDMLWTLFDQPHRKRGLRPSQRMIRDLALAGSQQRFRGREQIGPQVRFRHNNNNYRHNNEPPTHQHTKRNNVPTVSQQM